MIKYTIKDVKFEDYKTVSELKLKNSNRDIEEEHVKSLKSKLFKDGEWCKTMPVIVSVRTKNVLDGQHSRCLWMSLVENGELPIDSKLYVEYVDVNPDDEFELMHELNSGKNWNGNTFINSYVKDGVDDYVKLKDWCEDHPLCNTKSSRGKVRCKYRVAVAMMTGHRQEACLKEGKFSFSKTDAKIGNTIHSEISEMLKILDLSEGKANLESMATAWYKCRVYCTFDEWKSALKRNKKYLFTMGTLGDRNWQHYFNSVYGDIQARKAAMDLA